MIPNDIYDVYHVQNNKRHPSGRFMVRNGQVHHLSDYHGHLQSTVPQGPVDEVSAKMIQNPPAGIEIASRGQVKGGHYLHGIKEQELEEMMPDPLHVKQHTPVLRPPPVFHYFRAGMDKAHLVEVKGNQGSIDGHPLTNDELELILQNIQKGVAKLRYRQHFLPQILKAEQNFRTLAKAEDLPDAEEVLKELEGLQALGHVSDKQIKALRSHIFEDKMTPGIGNKYAWEKHRAKNAPGVYASLDLNDFKSINDTYGHDAGDAAIKAFGRAAREAADETGTEGLKLFRPGGDEFTLHADHPERAASFLRALHSKLDAIPRVGGVHKLSVSAGLGHNFETADKALYEAKTGKYHDPKIKHRKFAVGDSPHLTHSLIPGSEGPVPVDTSSMPLANVPVGQTPTIKLPSDDLPQPATANHQPSLNPSPSSNRPLP